VKSNSHHIILKNGAAFQKQSGHSQWVRIESRARLISLAVAAGGFSAATALVVERTFGNYASLIVFLALYFLSFWLAWVFAVRLSEPKHAAPAQ